VKECDFVLATDISYDYEQSKGNYTEDTYYGRPV